MHLDIACGEVKETESDLQLLRYWIQINAVGFITIQWVRFPDVLFSAVVSIEY